MQLGEFISMVASSEEFAFFSESGVSGGVPGPEVMHLVALAGVGMTEEKKRQLESAGILQGALRGRDVRRRLNQERTGVAAVQIQANASFWQCCHLPNSVCASCVAALTGRNQGI